MAQVFNFTRFASAGQIVKGPLRQGFLNAAFRHKLDDRPGIGVTHGHPRPAAGRLFAGQIPGCRSTVFSIP